MAHGACRGAVGGAGATHLPSSGDVARPPPPINCVGGPRVHRCTLHARISCVLPPGHVLPSLSFQSSSNIHRVCSWWMQAVFTVAFLIAERTLFLPSLGFGIVTAEMIDILFRVSSTGDAAENRRRQRPKSGGAYSGKVVATVVTALIVLW